MTEAKFIATLARENSRAELAQALVGLTPQSVACVYGAPGVGKTTQLRALVRSFVAGGLKPESILVFAATRDAAATLREDLLLDIQNQVQAVEGSLARTISSLAFAIVRHHVLSLGQKAPELISGSEQDAILAQLVAGLADGSQAIEGWPAHFDAKVFGLAGFRAELRDLLAAAQEHDLTAADLGEIGRQQNKSEWVAAAGLLEQYERRVSQPDFANRFDAPTLISFATEILASGEVNELISSFKCVIIDDAQELTPSAARFIEALLREGAGLIMFGDSDASTLGFRAADARIFSDLGTAVASLRSQNCTVIALLETAFARSADVSQLMARASAKIPGVGNFAMAHRKVHAGQSASGAKLDGQVLLSNEAEVAWLARQLREAHLHEGLAWQDMAVVARSRMQLEDLELALAAESVPVRIVGAQAALRDEFGARQMLDVLQLAFAEEYSIEDAIGLLGSALCGLDNLGLRRLRRQLRAAAIETGMQANSSQLIVEAVIRPDSLADIRSDESKIARRFFKRFEVTRRLAADPSTSIEDLLWQLWDSSAPCKEWPVLARGVGEIAVQANRNLDSVLALFAAANRYVERDPGASAYDFIRAQLDQAVPEDSLALSKRGAKTVDLLTPSGLIGRRYQLVAIPQLIEGVFPNLRPRSSLLGANVLSALQFKRISSAGDAVRTEFADEMRMLYKAVGASNDRVLLSAAELEDAQVSQFMHLAFGKIPEPIDFNKAALTLRGLAGHLRRELAGSIDEQATVQLSSALALLATEGVPGANPDAWYGLLPLSTEEPLFELEVSASDGEHEVEKVAISPSQLQAWADCPLHWFISNHGGKVQDFSANLGTVIHEALELNRAGTEAELMATVLSKWNTLEFESEWQSRAAKRKARKMVNILANYLAGFTGEVASVEQTFEFVHGNAKVIGKVDRIEVTPEGRVVIVDLKTGKKSVTKEEAENHAQLGVYQLAFEAGAFSEVEELEDLELGGAKLVIVGGDKLLQPAQRPLAESGNKTLFEKLLEDATESMAMTSRVFIANVSTHCDDDHSYGSCKLHLTKAVSYRG